MSSATSIQKGARRGGISTGVIILIVVVVLAAVGAAAVYVLLPRPEIVRVDGSSTVFPITSAWAAEFNNPSRQVVVAFSGTGGGFAKFCRGETDLSDASRPIKRADSDPATTTEEELCTQNGITGIVEFLVAYDGLSVVVNPQNTWVQNLTVGQLCRIWTSNTSAGACHNAGGRVTRWSELNGSWPQETIQLYGPGTDSGTFDYFVEVILGNKKSEHTDQYFASEDDNVLVQGVASNRNALGYFGYAYAIDNTDSLRILPIDNEDGDGAVLPSHDTIRQPGAYEPLSRPLFIYGSAGSLARQTVQDFLEFGYTARGTELVDQTGYVSLTEAERATERAKIP